MIHLDLEVTSRTINDEAMELIRVELRHRALQFVFDAVDTVSHQRGLNFNHQDIHVAGDIKLVPSESKS